MKRNSSLFLSLIIAALPFISCANKDTQVFENKENENPVKAIETAYSDLPSQQYAVAETGVEEDKSGKVIVLSEEEFIEKITEINNPKGFQYKGETPCVIDFYADWCRPCSQFIPVLNEVAKEYKGKVIIYKVNVDKAQRIAQALQVKSIPMFLFMKKNAQPAKMEGAPSKEEFVKAIEEVLL